MRNGTFANGTVKTLTTFLAGGLIGAGAALLFAPQSGRKTRRDLVYLGQRGKHRCKELGLGFRHSMDNVIDGIGERLDHSLENGKDWTAKARRRASQVLGSRGTRRDFRESRTSR